MKSCELVPPVGLTSQAPDLTRTLSLIEQSCSNWRSAITTPYLHRIATLEPSGDQITFLILGAVISPKTRRLWTSNKMARSSARRRIRPDAPPSKRPSTFGTGGCTRFVVSLLKFLITIWRCWRSKIAKRFRPKKTPGPRQAPLLPSVTVPLGFVRENVTSS